MPTPTRGLPRSLEGPPGAPLTDRPECGGVVAGAGRRGLRVVLVLVLWLVLGALVALTVAPRVLPVRTMAAVSGSMAPTMPVGSLAVAVPVRAEDVRPGQVVTFAHPERPGRLVTHRVVAVSTDSAGRRLTTKGDANGAADSWQVRPDGQGWRVVTALPYMGRLLGGTSDQRLRLLVAFVLLGALLREIWRRDRSASHSV